MLGAAKVKKQILWTTIKTKFTKEPAPETHIPMFLRRDATRTNMPEVDVTSPIQIMVISRDTSHETPNPRESTESQNSNEAIKDDQNNLSTFFTDHLECMYQVGVSPISVRNHLQDSGWKRMLHKVAFYTTGAISISQGVCDVKYYAINVAKSGTIRDVADLCYMITRMILRGTVLLKFSRDSEEIRDLSQKVDSLAGPEMKKVDRKKIILIGGSLLAVCFLTPFFFLVVAFGDSEWNLHNFLEEQFLNGLFDILHWSTESKTYEILGKVSWTAKCVGGIVSVLSNTVARTHKLLTWNILNTATITVDNMTNAFLSELQVAKLPAPSNDPRVGTLPKTVWDTYERTKEASTTINDTFGTLFNVVHVLFILQWIFFVHTLLKNTTDANVPFDAIELAIACVMYNRMRKISDVTDKFREWICAKFRSAFLLKVEGQTDGSISMMVMLEELQERKIGIRGGVGVVTKAFMLVCFSLAVEYFITLWTEA